MRAFPGIVAGAALISLSAMHADVYAQAGIEQARQLYLDADFEGARAAFGAVLEDPDLDFATALEAHRHLATLSMLLGSLDAARPHAEAALALDPGAEPPPGSPPEASDLFDELRSRAAGPVALTIEVDGDGEGGAPVRVVARAEPAPDALIAAMHLECASESDVVEEGGAPPAVELFIPAVGEVICDAEALTVGGATLFATDRRFGGASGGDDGSGDTAGGGGSPWLWLAAGAALAIAGGLVAALVISNTSHEAALGRPQVSGW